MRRGQAIEVELDYAFTSGAWHGRPPQDPQPGSQRFGEPPLQLELGAGRDDGSGVPIAAVRRQPQHGIDLNGPTRPVPRVDGSVGGRHGLGHDRWLTSSVSG